MLIIEIFFGSLSNAKLKGSAHVKHVKQGKWEKFGHVLSEKKGNFIMINEFKYGQT